MVPRWEHSTQGSEQGNKSQEYFFTDIHRHKENIFFFLLFFLLKKEKKKNGENLQELRDASGRFLNEKTWMGGS